jgi:glycosyltransferase involved in cell wall biosynthesis
MKNNNISILVVARNEEKNIERCLSSVKDFSDELIVVDNESTDSTAKLSKKYTPNVFKHNGKTYEDNINYGLTKVSNEWVLAVDADEVLTSGLKKELVELDLKPSKYNGYRVCFKQIFISRQVDPHNILGTIRLYKSTSRYEDITPHTPISVYGEVGALKGHILHFFTPSIESFIKKTNEYSEFEAEKLYKQGKKLSRIRLLLKPINAFYLSYFKARRYKFGLHGFLYSLMVANYEFMKGIKLFWLGVPSELKDFDLEVKKELERL